MISEWSIEGFVVGNPARQSDDSVFVSAVNRRPRYVNGQLVENDTAYNLIATGDVAEQAMNKLADGVRFAAQTMHPRGTGTTLQATLKSFWVVQ